MPRIATYVFRIMADDQLEGDDMNQAVYDEYVNNAVTAAQDAANDVLPDGYYVKIEE